MNIPQLLLTAYILLMVGMTGTDGAYHPISLLFVLASFATLAFAFFTAARRGPHDWKAPGPRTFAAAVVILLLGGLVKPAGLYLQTQSLDYLYRGALALLVVLVVGAFVVRGGANARVMRAVFGLAVVIAIVFRIWMPIASPNPRIDVFKVSQESAQSLLRGQNPYSVPIDIAYPGQARYTFPGYVYLPADLYLQTASYALTGDVRYILVLAELLTALFLWKLARRRWGEPTSQLLVMLFLFAPRALFMIEQAWLDSLILTFFALSMLLYDRDKPWKASVAYGYMLFMKQYLFFAVFQWLIIEKNRKRILTGLGVGLLTLAPFAIANWHALLTTGILLNVTLPFRTDSLTVASFVALTWGLKPPMGWSVIVGAILTIATFRLQRGIEPLRGYLFALTTTTFGMFLFGSSAFYNWYYLVAGQMLFLLVLGTTGGSPKAEGRPAS